MDPRDQLGQCEAKSAMPSDIKEHTSTQISPVESIHTAEASAIDLKAEQRLLRQFDFRILPILALMYLFNSLDKANLGNAKTAGLVTDLNMSQPQYNTMLSIFFVPYVLFAPFITLAGKKFGPHRVLPILMMTFGSMTVLSLAAFNFAGMMTLRWFLGMAEGAFFPLVIYYQTTFYRRGELARRLAVFYAAQSIASAFGGLLAFGVFHIHGGALFAWKYLFAIEGSCTVLVAVFAYFYLPKSAAECWFLVPEEKALAFHRMQIDSSSVVNEEFKLKSAVQILRHPTSWVILLIEVCLGIPLQSVTLFLPQIIARLEYDTVTTNLLTVAPNVTGAVMLLVLAFTSDLTRLRSPFVALGFLFTMIGFVIYAVVDISTQLQVAYFATFMMCWGTSAPSVLLDVWYNNNIADENKRVFLSGLGVPLANLMGVVSSNIFLPEEAPRYETALVTTAIFGGIGCLLTLGLGAWMYRDNRRRDRQQGQVQRAQDVATSLLAAGPSTAEYRWFL